MRMEGDGDDVRLFGVLRSVEVRGAMVDTKVCGGAAAAAISDHTDSSSVLPRPCMRGPEGA